ncbi:hypothetical protein D3C75_659800 [compost metagenome]
MCTLATCNDYVIDTASTVQDANVNTHKQDDRFLTVWEDEKLLTEWLTEFKIGETVFEIVSLEMETKEIKEDELP